MIMLTPNRAGPILGSLYSSVRLVGPRSHSWTPRPHQIRSFSHSSRRAKVSGLTVLDPITGNPRRRTPDAPPPNCREQEDAAVCRQAIEEGEDPETLFKSRLHAGTLSRSSAAVCLMEASQRGHSKTKLGQTALAWLWDQRGDLIYPDDNGLVYAMADLLVSEGQEKELWRWISSESTRPRSLPPFIRFEWRDTALKGLLLAKAKLSTHGSLDEVIETYLRSNTVFVPSGGVTRWMYIELTRYKRLRAHEMSPSVNGGRRWNHAWPNTSIKLWDKAVEMLPRETRISPMHQAVLPMFGLGTPNPEPMRMLFENALTDLDHPLRALRFIKSINAYRSFAQYASDELRRIGRYDDAARLDKACEEIIPRPREYGDRPDREGIFAQGKPAKKIPFPKYK